MTQNQLLVGSVLCMVCGIADLGALNLWLAPAAWPTTQTTVPEFKAVLEQGVATQPTRKASSLAKTPATRPTAVQTVVVAANTTADAKLPPQLTVHFDPARAQLSSADQQSLDALAKDLRGKRVTLRVTGHTDSTGSAAVNQRLSELRAAIVASRLTKRIDMNLISISTHGLGASQPVEAAESTDERSRNRRAVVHIQIEQ